MVALQSKYLLSAYYVLSILLGSGNTKNFLKKTKIPVLM